VTQGEVSRHYTVSDLGDVILGALEKAGKDVDNLTVDDLAPVDQFHIRGRMATEELASWAALAPGQRLLDVGCGIGGTGRYLAANFGCDVVGVDLTEEYCRVGDMLSARVGLSDKTTFRQASALELPFDDASFDVVWTEHVQMNIEDKATFYAEIARVLKPDGQFAFHDVFGGRGGDVHFPVPWAEVPAISHLVAVEKLPDVLNAAGFVPAQWEDKTEPSTRFFEGVLQRVRDDGWMPLGLHLLMGDRAEEKFANMHRNLEEGRVTVVQAVLRK
jgi:ubiquinone/menaquinone biosynthesis C-methylase UbiE